MLPSLTPLEATYYAYQRRISRALAKPISASTEWFFKKGSTAEKSLLAFDKKLDKEDGTEAEARAFEMAQEEVEGAAKVVQRENEADKTGDVRSLERKGDRTVYLLLKKDRKSHAWQFREFCSYGKNGEVVGIDELCSFRSPGRCRTGRVAPRGGST